MATASAGSAMSNAMARSSAPGGSSAASWLASNDVMRLSPRAGVRPGALWLATASRQTRLQINALSFGSVVDHMNPWDVENILVPPVPDHDAATAEDAWDSFSNAEADLHEAVRYLQAFLSR